MEKSFKQTCFQVSKKQPWSFSDQYLRAFTTTADLIIPLFLLPFSFLIASYQKLNKKEGVQIFVLVLGNNTIEHPLLFAVFPSLYSRLQNASNLLRLYTRRANIVLCTWAPIVTYFYQGRDGGVGTQRTKKNLR